MEVSQSPHPEATAPPPLKGLPAMDYRTYSVWTLPPQSEVFPRSLHPVACNRPSPAGVPSALETGIVAMIKTGWEWIRGIARWLIGGVEFAQRFLAQLGRLSATRTPIARPAVVVPQSLHVSPSVWALTSAREWADFGRGSTSDTASVPPSPPSVVQSSESASTPSASLSVIVDPPHEGHQNAPVVEEEEPAANPDLARAWLLATHPLRDADVSVEEVAWDEIPLDEVRGILSAAISTRARACHGVRPGCERDVLGDWLGTVATIAYVDPGDRLRWMATLAPTLARHGISDDRRDELLGTVAGWLREIDLREPGAVLGALRLVERIAASGIDPGGTLFEEAGPVWGERAWPRMRAGDATELLQVSVTQMTAALARGDGPRARMFAYMLLALASACHVRVADRLMWFAQAVARPVGVAGLDGSPVRDVLTAGVGRWFEALSKQRRSTCDAVDVVLAWWQVPLGACTHEAPMAKWISQARPDPDPRDRAAHERTQARAGTSAGTMALIGTQGAATTATRVAAPQAAVRHDALALRDRPAFATGP